MAGQQLIGGRYRIGDIEKDILGEGGMGKVYLGEDTESGQKVAIKMLRRERFDNNPEALERFQREGELLRQLDHPNIVKMLEAIEEGGQHYLVMEYVEGGDLNDRLAKDGKPSIEETLAISLELADALTRAHHLNVIHRDIKPANVLMAPDHTPRLTDFGISHYSDQERLTVDGGLVGTIPYLSPEGCTGRGLDPRADIWSFGVLLYELLTGELPFRGEDAVATITAILQHDLPDMQQVNGEIPDGVADLVGRMLVKDAEGRMPSMRLVGAEIEALIKGYDYTPASPRGKKLLDAVHADTSTFATPELDTQEKKINLPAQATRFIGREKELREIIELLSHPEGRLVTLLGPGGMGKTRLGIEAARRMAPAFEHGVHFVDLAAIVEPERIPLAIAQALGLHLEEELDLVEQLVFYFRDKNLLLLMDNFEHLLDGATVLSEILPNSPQVKILVTSRARLELDDERVYEVAGMLSPADESEVVFEEIEAVELFLQQARRSRPDYDLEESDKTAVVKICHLVGGMPLAIKLAAGWVHTLPPEDIACELSKDVDFLESQKRDLPERQRSMRAVFDYSWKLLPEKHREIFMRLSVFRGGFTREAGTQVVGAGVKDLADLVAWSLLQRGEDGRFSVHELMRQFATEALLATGEEENSRGRHSAYFAEMLEALLHKIKKREQLEAFDQIEADFENVRAAWEWASDRQNPEQLLAMGESLFWLQNHHMSGIKTKPLFRQGAEALGANPVEDNVLAAARLVSYIQVFQIGVEEKPLIEKGLEIAELRQDILSEAWLNMGLSKIVGNVELDYEATLFLYEKSAAKFKQAGDDALWAFMNNWCGQAVHELGDQEAGREVIQQSLQMFRELGNQDGILDSLGDIGFRFHNEGKLDKAEAYYQEVIEMCKDARYRGRLSGLYATYAWLCEARGELEIARRYANESIALEKEFYGAAIKSGPIAILGNIELRQENLDKANELYQRAYALEQHYMMDFHGSQGLGMIAGLRGEIGEALSYLCNFMQNAPSAIDKAYNMQLWLLILAEEKKYAEAVETLSFMQHYKSSWPTKSLENHPWFQRLLPKLKEELTEEEYEAAWERGKKLELDEIVERILEEGNLEENQADG